MYNNKLVNETFQINGCPAGKLNKGHIYIVNGKKIMM